MGTKTIQMTGKVYGGLTVLSRAGRERSFATWLCRCECGKEVVVRGDRLRSGLRQVCSVVGHTKKGRGPTVEHRLTYSTWRHMLRRCTNPAEGKFPLYGGRGIKVCERWAEFPAFLADAGERPGPQYTLDRLDVNGNYEPGNIRWATASEQRRNSRDAFWLEYEGKRHKLADFCDLHGLGYSIFAGRIRNGWPVDVAMTAPKSHRHKKRLP